MLHSASRHKKDTNYDTDDLSVQAHTCQARSLGIIWHRSTTEVRCLSPRTWWGLRRAEPAGAFIDGYVSPSSRSPSWLAVSRQPTLAHASSVGWHLVQRVRGEYGRCPQLLRQLVQIIPIQEDDALVPWSEVYTDEAPPANLDNDIISHPELPLPAVPRQHMAIVQSPHEQAAANGLRSYPHLS